MESLFQCLDVDDDRCITWQEFHRFYTNQVVPKKSTEPAAIKDVDRSHSPRSQKLQRQMSRPDSSVGTLSIPGSAWSGDKRERASKRQSRTPRKTSKMKSSGILEENPAKPMEPMLLVIMEPHRG